MFILIVILFILSIALNVFLVLNILKLLDVTSNYEDNVSTSVLIVEQAESVVSELLERPLLMDTPEVREILDHLKNVKRAIITIASTLGITVELEEDIDDKKKR